MPPCGLSTSAAFIKIFLLDFVFNGMPVLLFKIERIYSTYDLIFIKSKQMQIKSPRYKDACVFSAGQFKSILEICIHGQV